MTIKADLGFINIAPEVLADIAGYAAMSCFGVKGMTIRSVSDGIAHLLRRENMSRGVRITEAEDGGAPFSAGPMGYRMAGTISS